MDTAIVPIQPDLPADIPALLDHLAETQPTVALAIAHALGSESMPALRPTVRRVTEVLESDACLDEEIEFIVSRAVTAQETFENWSDDRIDALLFELSRLFAENAEQLAAATVRETGMGKVTDKTIKNRFASQTVYQSLAGRTAQGPLSFDVARRVTEIAGSMGVVFAVAPVTSPIATAIFKTLITLKGRNALILSFPHQALGVGQLAGGMVRDVLAEHGAPAALVQWVQLRGNRKATRRFMGHPKVAMVLATGSAGLVRAAYSSGTPAIGVGPGNAPAWICADADLDQAARLIVSSKTFDNGLICGAEHNLVVDDRVLHPFSEALKKYGAAVLVQDEEPRFYRRGIHPQSRRLRREFIGQSADVIAALIGIPRPYAIRLLVAPVGEAALTDFYGGEKLAPILSMFVASGEDHGLRLCRSLLKKAGAGHTAIIHSSNAARIDRFARQMPASRILVNAPGSQGCCGMETGLECSMTLGCGTYGGNSTNDNVTYRHLLNIKRIAHRLEA